MAEPSSILGHTTTRQMFADRKTVTKVRKWIKFIDKKYMQPIFGLPKEKRNSQHNDHSLKHGGVGYDAEHEQTGYVGPGL